MPFVPDLAEEKIDDWIARRLAGSERGRHLFSFVERGGWFSADPFVAWMERKLNEVERNGQPRQLGASTLEEFFAATGVEMTLVAADTTWSRMLLLNHRTTPDLPVAWAARMSMSVPLLWQEVEWQADWGPYQTWNPTAAAGTQRRPRPRRRGWRSALQLPDRALPGRPPDVAVVIGPASIKMCWGCSSTNRCRCPTARPTRRPAEWRASSPAHRPTSALGDQHGHRRARQYGYRGVRTHVGRLAAGGYSTTQVDMTDPSVRRWSTPAGERCAPSWRAGPRACR